MKCGKRILALVIGFALALSLSTAAYAVAAVTRTFFVQKCGSYNCTATGTLNLGVCRATLKAESLPNQAVLPDEQNEIDIWVLAYNSNGEFCGSTHQTNDGLTCTAQYTCTSCTSHSRMGCSFKFNGEDLGLYLLYATGEVYPTN
ncbi:MAG: hypothetical protein LUJ09_06895 [Firmicutes bacterium]|nr:hypothetical protein [Bacillota bacterium]